MHLKHTKELRPNFNPAVVPGCQTPPVRSPPVRRRLKLAVLLLGLSATLIPLLVRVFPVWVRGLLYSYSSVFAGLKPVQYFV